MNTTYNYKELANDNLVLLLKDSNHCAFKEIYGRHASDLAAYVNSKIDDLTETHDVLQELFTTLWEQRDNLHPSGDLRSYLFEEVGALIIKRIRQNVTCLNYRAFVTTAIGNSNQYTPATGMMQLNRQVRGTVNKLSKRTMQIFELSLQKHYSIEEISSKLNMSEQRVKSQLTTALAYLKQIVVNLTFVIFYYM